MSGPNPAGGVGETSRADQLGRSNPSDSRRGEHAKNLCPGYDRQSVLTFCLIAVVCKRNRPDQARFTPLARECRSARSCPWQSGRSEAGGGRWPETGPHQSGRQRRSSTGLCHGGRLGPSRIHDAGREQTLPAGYASTVAVAAGH